MRGISTRTLVATGVLVALVLAGAVSFYASTSPDGLSRVAADHGLSGTQRPATASTGPLAGYETRGVDNPRFSRGTAGVLGSLVVLSLTAGATVVVRRGRGPVTAPEGD
jgi:cobalt/nickel transport protein